MNGDASHGMRPPVPVQLEGKAPPAEPEATTDPALLVRADPPNNRGPGTRELRKGSASQSPGQGGAATPTSCTVPLTPPAHDQSDLLSHTELRHHLAES